MGKPLASLKRQKRHSPSQSSLEKPARPRKARLPSKIKNTPRLIASPNNRPPKPSEPNTYSFRYDVKRHMELPHVVKFSGGRSSGLLLFSLLESGLLKQERGDVVVFNDTSAEHPETYEFTAMCKRVVEDRYGIPFFWIQFQTYEDARGGEWTRLPTYRLVKPVPWSEEESDGYHHKGEAFEEMLSWAGYVPNQFQRTCTKTLKLETTRMFLRDWFACKEGIDRLGHYSEVSRLDGNDMYAKHKRHRGGVPREIFLEKKAYLRSRPVFRPEQVFHEYSHSASSISNEFLEEKSFGNDAHFGVEGVEYAAFVGLRHDEMRRVVKVRHRNAAEAESDGYEVEHVYMPLADMGITKEDVDKFWSSNKQMDLKLDSDSGLSNCVYCFLKGLGVLEKVHQTMKGNEFADSPCDINWWKRIEQTYGRDLVAEKREVRGNVKGGVIGFFGTSSGFSYEVLASDGGRKGTLSGFSDTVLPCDCTD